MTGLTRETLVDREWRAPRSKKAAVAPVQSVPVHPGLEARLFPMNWTESERLHQAVVPMIW